MEKEHREKQDCCRAFRRGGSFICAGDLLLLCLHSPTRQGSVIIIPPVPTDLGVFAYSNPAAPALKSWFLVPGFLEGSW